MLTSHSLCKQRMCASASPFRGCSHTRPLRQRRRAQGRLPLARTLVDENAASRVEALPEGPQQQKLEGATDHKLRIQPLQHSPQLLQGTADLLTDVFVEANQFDTYRTLLRMRISSYLKEQLTLTPRTIILVALLSLNGEQAEAGRMSESTSEEATSSESQASQEVLVGTAEVSFDRITHSRHLYLNPPARAAYLCNMAVSPNFRGLGIGRTLLGAVESLAKSRGEEEMYLHVRSKDLPAVQLYTTAGFQEAGREWWVLCKLFMRDQKLLLAKRV